MLSPVLPILVNISVAYAVPVRPEAGENVLQNFKNIEIQSLRRREQGVKVVGELSGLNVGYSAERSWPRLCYTIMEYATDVWQHLCGNQIQCPYWQ